MKLLHNLGCLKTRLGLECSSPALNKHECCKNTKGTNHVQLIVSILSLLCEILADCIFVERWTGALQVQPRFRNTFSNFNFIFGMFD